MPILRKGGNALYFAHIPKTAGSSLYMLFLANGYHMANFGRPDGPLGTTGTAQEVREKYGITEFQKEGDFSGVTTSLQHVTADIWANWGPFDQSFAIAREPLARFRSAYTYRYLSSIGQSGVEHSPAILSEFRNLIMPFLEVELMKAPHAFDNHFRPQTDFITDATHIHKLEAEGLVQLKSALGLQGDIPHEKKAGFHVELGDREMAFYESYYETDIKWYAAL